MEDKKKYFDTLGLRSGANQDEIAKTYRALMEYWNPDRVPDFYKQKAMEGRDQIEEAYQELMGFRKETRGLSQKPEQVCPDCTRPGKDTAKNELVFLGKDREGASVYLDKTSITFSKDTVHIEIDIYLSEGSARFNTAQGYVRRAGYKGLECLTEKWGLGLASGVYIKHSQYFKSTCGHLVLASGELRKVWKPIAPGTLEETVWKVVDAITNKEKVA